MLLVKRVLVAVAAVPAVPVVLAFIVADVAYDATYAFFLGQEAADRRQVRKLLSRGFR